MHYIKLFLLIVMALVTRISLSAPLAATLDQKPFPAPYMTDSQIASELENRLAIICEFHFSGRYLYEYCVRWNKPLIVKAVDAMVDEGRKLAYHKKVGFL